MTAAATEPNRPDRARRGDFIKTSVNKECKHMINEKELSEKDRTELEEITEKIFQGLPADISKEVDYLDKMLQKYSRHRLGESILPLCMKISHETLPKEVSQELAMRLVNYVIFSDDNLDRAEFYIGQRELKKAYRLLKKTKREVTSAILSFEGNPEKYHGFNNYFEDAFYTRFYDPKRKFNPCGSFFARIYRSFAVIEFLRHRLEKARGVLQKAMEYRPMEFEFHADYAETFRSLGDLEKYRELTLGLFEVAYQPKQIVRCYYNLGDYYKDQKRFDVAHVCYFLGYRYCGEDEDRNENVGFLASYFTLERLSGIPFREMTRDETDALCEKYGIPRGPSPRIIEFAESSGRFFFEREEFGEAHFFLSIFLGLISPLGDKEKIDEIKTLVEAAKVRAEKQAKERAEEERAGETDETDEENLFGKDEFD